MIEIKLLKQNLTKVWKTLETRGAMPDVEIFKSNDEKRKTVLYEIEELRHKRNVASETIAKMKKNGENTDELVAKMRTVSDRIKFLDKKLSENDQLLKEFILGLPNLPHPSVPIGKSEADNPVIKTFSRPATFEFDPKAHWDLGEDLGILDFNRAAAITGARFPLYMGAGARLERALINFMLDVHTVEHNFKEVLPPFIVNRKSMTNTGQLPKFEEDLFKLNGWDYYLIPTAEVPVTNIHQNEILEEEQLPICYTAYTPCFRSEAGSYGKDTRGLIRQHQFSKVELVKFSLPENSYEELESLLESAESILKKLELPYRVVALCTGDLGFSAAKTYDIEVWMPAQGVYREISSCSNFESFQARRANIRFRRKGRKGTELVHTLNGSGIAVGRTVAAILENFQQKDGSVNIPEALRPYLGGEETIQRENR
jgi:seryl-tRNA synthetase